MTERKFSVSLYTSAKDNAPAPAEVTWAELTEALASFDARVAKDGPAWSPAKISGPRATENVEFLCALVYDLDEADPTVAHPEALTAVAHAWHSTHSGGWRLVVPLSRDVSPSEHRALWESTARRFGIEPDRAAKDSARLFYLPSHPPGGEGQAVAHDGPMLDPGPGRADTTADTRNVGDSLRSAPVTVPLEISSPGNDSRAGNPLDVGALIAKLMGGGQARADARKLLTCAFEAQPGERNERLHKAMSALARALPPEVDDEPVVELISKNFGTTMPLGDEPLEHWVAVARSSLARRRQAVARELQTIQGARAAIDALAPVPDTAAYGSSLEGELRLTEKQKVKNIPYNLEQILERDPRFAGKLRFNGLTRDIEVAPGCPLHGQPPNHLDTALTSWLGGSEFAMDMAPAIAAQVLRMVATRHAYNPVRDWLESLAWDNVPRLATFFQEYCGTEGNADYLKQVAQKFFVSCVARAYQPGCKVDTMLILQGAQGVGKTRLVRLLANDGAWSTTLKLDVHNKDSIQVATSHWLVELAELATMRRSDLESFKAFLTTPVDSVRLPYERTNVNYPRRAVFVGTTNDHEFLADETGNRRFWPVSVKDVRYKEVESILGQLWAEAVALYKAGAEWWVGNDSTALFESETSVYAREGGIALMAARISEWYVKKPTPRPQHLATRDIAQYALLQGIEEQLNDRGLFMRIGAACRMLGMVRERHTVGPVGESVRPWLYKVPDKLRDADRLSIVENNVTEKIGAAK